MELSKVSDELWMIGWKLYPVMNHKSASVQKMMPELLCGAGQMICMVSHLIYQNKVLWYWGWLCILPQNKERSNFCSARAYQRDNIASKQSGSQSYCKFIPQNGGQKKSKSPWQRSFVHRQSFICYESWNLIDDKYWFSLVKPKTPAATKGKETAT